MELFFGWLPGACPGFCTRLFFTVRAGLATPALRGALSVSRLAQLVERKTLNLVVVGSSPTVGALLFAPAHNDVRACARN